MIDWLTLFLPFDSPEPICSGFVTSTDSNGELDYKTLKRLSLSGSYESTVTVRSCYRSEFKDTGHIFNALEISGNPSKYFQGHNVFGTDDIVSLTNYLVESIYNHLGVQDAKFLAHCSSGSIILTRVDINYSYHLPNASSVKQWLYSAESSAVMKHRGRGLMDKGTLYFGKKSKRSTIKFYHKGQEIIDNKKHQYIEHPVLTEFANKSLRCELKLSSLELSDLNLKNIFSWQNINVYDLYLSYISKLEFNMNLKEQTVKDLSGLTPKQLSIYALWKDGHDLKVVYSKSSFYRFRKQILDAISVDISVAPGQSLHSNVVPLFSYLEAKPALIPQSAYDNNLVYVPAQLKIV